MQLNTLLTSSSSTSIPPFASVFVFAITHPLATSLIQLPSNPLIHFSPLSFNAVAVFFSLAHPSISNSQKKGHRQCSPNAPLNLLISLASSRSRIATVSTLPNKPLTTLASHAHRLATVVSNLRLTLLNPTASSNNLLNHVASALGASTCLALLTSSLTPFGSFRSRLTHLSSSSTSRRPSNQLQHRLSTSPFPHAVTETIPPPCAVATALPSRHVSATAGGRRVPPRPRLNRSALTGIASSQIRCLISGGSRLNCGKLLLVSSSDEDVGGGCASTIFSTHHLLHRVDAPLENPLRARNLLQQLDRAELQVPRRHV
uniref:Uncharacterized protein n=1 Tax=Colletotrichum fructicola (strain Nara gc5) TaxID=1213859 RepID=L2FFT6_COLFN